MTGYEAASQPTAFFESVGTFPAVKAVTKTGILSQTMTVSSLEPSGL